MKDNNNLKITDIVKKISPLILSRDNEKILKAKKYVYDINKKIIKLPGNDKKSNEIKDYVISSIYYDLMEAIEGVGLQGQLHMVDVLCIINGDTDDIMSLLDASNIPSKLSNMSLTDKRVEEIKKTLGTLDAKTTSLILQDIIDMKYVEFGDRNGNWHDEKLLLIKKLYENVKEDIKENDKNIGLNILLAAEHNDVKKVETFAEIMPQTVTFIARSSVDVFEDILKKDNQMQKDLIDSDVISKPLKLSMDIKPLRLSMDIITNIQIKTGANLMNYMDDETKEKFIKLAIDSYIDTGDKRMKLAMEKIKNANILMTKNKLKINISNSKGKNIRKM